MVEKRDVKIDLPSDAIKAKGYDNLEKLEEGLKAGDQAVADKTAREERIAEQDERIAEQDERIAELEAAAPAVVDGDPGNGERETPQEWGLGGGDVEQKFQQDFMGGRGFATVAGMAGAISKQQVEKAMKDLVSPKLAKLEAKQLEYDIKDSIADQNEQAILQFGADWCEKHKDVATKTLTACIKENRPLNKDEMMTEFMKVKLKEDKVSNSSVADAVGEAKGNASFLEGEGDGATSSSSVPLKQMSVAEMEKVLPVADPNKPIEEGQ